jgi:hypothetical protein
VERENKKEKNVLLAVEFKLKKQDDDFNFGVWKGGCWLCCWLWKWLKIWKKGGWGTARRKNAERERGG